ncbi:thiosulfate:glutathione sulfurtransferase isoform 2-T2 [Anomaloglossus baeobatrachus]|uniref:thiosulfate:glutathione sulfurtransferase isoform X2 n=1 Tax=Anomaloglossus baeobatrachus TaxID=238106 RepID=UPI003F507C50
MLLRNCLPQLRLVTRNTGNTMSADAVISYDEVKKLISSGQGRIIDVRTAEEVSNGKIPGATNIPVTQVEDALKMDLETFKWKYHVEKPQLEDHNLVFYCQLGKRGQRATEIAQSLGYKHACNYPGAYKEWSEKEGK